jgi:tRNA A58 N-methylase Trm61
MLRMTDLAHLIVGAVLQPGDWAVDATVGNGHDTAFLAACVGPSGRVFGFDVQASALAAATRRLRGHNAVTLLHRGHEHIADALPGEASGRVAAVMFNLGYLPGGDKAIITTAETTLRALTGALSLLRVGGVVTVVLYPAHPGGGAEAEAVRGLAVLLPQALTVTHHTRLGADRPVPELLVIERVR